jgi:hypothetical protein
MPLLRRPCDEMTVRTRIPSSSPPYALRKGERDFVPLGKGDAALLAAGGLRKRRSRHGCRRSHGIFKRERFVGLFFSASALSLIRRIPNLALHCDLIES